MAILTAHKLENEMKLVEILARELSCWEFDLPVVTQENCGNLWYADSGVRVSESGNTWFSSGGHYGAVLTQADDRKTAIVTREMWQAERDRISAPYVSKEEAMALIDEHYSFVGRLEGPLKWRDRIKEIDITVDDLEIERADMIQRLADEGLALLRVDGKAVPKQPVEDVSDWRNWRVGDTIEAIDKSGGYSPGNLYEISGFDRERNAVLTALDDSGSKKNGWAAKFFKFHSRP